MVSNPGSDTTVPILLLKTKNQPVDTYEECLTQSIGAFYYGEPREPASYNFEPLFIPVLEHFTVSDALSRLEHDLEDGSLKTNYGGMIFTSQRAVEAWAEVVHRVMARCASPRRNVQGQERSVSKASADPFADLNDLTEFPIYVVGPATERVLQALSNEYESRGEDRSAASPFLRLNAKIYGADSGNGASLAAFIIQHYNDFHKEHWFNYFEAPRLPFVPLLGMSSENYGRKRMDPSDERLRKKPLLFLVGEVRRDIIPKTLSAKGLERSIEVEELEVYRTGVMKGFEKQLSGIVSGLQTQDTSNRNVGVIVVFSPQGSRQMLESIGFLDREGHPTEKAQSRVWTSELHSGAPFRWIIASIGPTTRDYLRDRLGITPDVCADKPNPQSLKRCIEDFLQEHKLLGDEGRP